MRPETANPRRAAARARSLAVLVLVCLCASAAHAQGAGPDALHGPGLAGGPEPLHRARWATLAGRVDDAILSYSAVLEKAPDDVESRVARARLLGWRSRHADAERDYERVLARHPRDWDARVGLARVLGRQGQSDEAQRILHELAAEAPTELAPHLQLGHLHLREGRFAQAERAFEAALALDPTDPTARASLGGAVWAQGDAERGRRTDLESLDALDARVTVHPRDVEARIARARVLARLGRAADAAAELDALLAGSHAYGEPELLRAQLELRLGRPGEALRQAEVLLAADPLWHEAHVLRGDALFRLGERGEAERAFASALELEPHDAEPLLGVARCREAEGDVDGALAAVEQALALQPGRRDAREMLAHLRSLPPRTPWRVDLAVRHDELDRGQPSWLQQSAWLRYQVSSGLGLTLGLDAYDRADREDVQLSALVDWRFAPAWSLALLYAHGFEAEVVAQHVGEVELARGFGSTVGLLRWRHSEFDGGVRADMLSPGVEFPLGADLRLLARYYFVYDSEAGDGHAGSLRADLWPDERVRGSLGVSYGVESFLADSIDQVVRGGNVLTLSAGVSWQVGERTRLWLVGDWEDHEEAYEKFGIALGISLEL